MLIGAAGSPRETPNGIEPASCRERIAQINLVLALGFFMPPRALNLESRIMTTPIETTSAAPAIVWGAAAIAPHIGRSVKGAFGALESGKVPGAKKIAGRWALNLSVYFAAFQEAA
jgi:hypothetical protein